MTGTFIGAFRFFQSGNNSSSARGSNTAPDNICAPTSAPLSITQTEKSCLCCWQSCLKRIAAAKPAGPAPTITISICITGMHGSVTIQVKQTLDW